MSSLPGCGDADVLVGPVSDVLDGGGSGAAAADDDDDDDEDDDGVDVSSAGIDGFVATCSRCEDLEPSSMTSSSYASAHGEITTGVTARLAPADDDVSCDESLNGEGARDVRLGRMVGLSR